MIPRIVYVVKCNGLYWTGGKVERASAEWKDGQPTAPPTAIIGYWSPARADAYEYRHVGDAQSIHNSRPGIEIVSSAHFEPELDLSF